MLLRRPRSGGTQDTYADSRLSISFAERAVRYDDREIALTRLEYRLLSAFVAHPNQVLSHEQLRELVWGDTTATSRDEVKLYVGYLRRKLDPEAPGGTPIETSAVSGIATKLPISSGFPVTPRFRPSSSRFPPRDVDPGAATNLPRKDRHNAQLEAASRTRRGPSP